MRSPASLSMWPLNASVPAIWWPITGYIARPPPAPEIPAWPAYSTIWSPFFWKSRTGRTASRRKKSRACGSALRATASCSKCVWPGPPCAIARIRPRPRRAKRVYKENKMSKLRFLIFMAAALAPAGVALAQYVEGPPGDSFFQKPGTKSAADDRLLQKGKAAIDAARWDEAVQAFSAVASEKGTHADEALYWKAYSLNKIARRAEALTAIAQLRQVYANSRWQDDAKALEIEVRQASGEKVNPNAEPDEDLKLMALNSLMNSDTQRAIPMLEKFLQGNQSSKLKERALFVLAQNDSPEGCQILLRIARGGAHPDLQMKAINYLGIMGSKENRQALADLYASSADTNVKRTVLHTFMISGDHGHLLQAAKSEKNADLRMEAIHQLGVSGAQTEDRK